MEVERDGRREEGGREAGKEGASALAKEKEKETEKNRSERARERESMRERDRKKETWPSAPAAGRHLKTRTYPYICVLQCVAVCYSVL